MNLQLEGKTVVVAGGSTGIGLACAHAFAQEGARVAILGRRPAPLEQARSDVSEAHGSEVIAVPVDLAREVEVEKALSTVEAAFGAVTVLVNCAGSAQRCNFLELDEAAWRHGFESKFMPYINMCTAVLRRFHQQRQREAPPSNELAIVNVIGKGGKAPSSTHLPGGAANAALMLATAGLAQAWGSMGVRINAVNPASIQTERLIRRHATASLADERSSAERLRDAAKDIPMGRFGEPHEVADVVLFLASPRASYVQGSHLVMDGGLRPIV